MYEAVRLPEDGPTTPARFAATATRYGFDGLVYLGEPGQEPPDLDPIGAEFEIELGWGVALTVTDRGTASQAVQRLRDDVDVLRVSAKDRDLQRFAAGQELVDVLAWPVGEGEPIGYTVARTAAEHGVSIELDLGPVLRTAGGRRVRAMRELRRVAELVDHDDLPVVLSGSPSSHLELRAPRELRAIAAAIDVPGGLADAGLAGWGELLERSRRARSDTFIEPGVRRCPDEADDR